MPSNIKNEFATIDLGDQRLDERLLRCAGRLAQDPQASVRAACKGEAEVKATYRLLHNEKLDMAQLLAAHRQAGLMRASGCSPQEALLFIQDTTELDFTTHKALSGAGPLSDLSLRGFYLHHHLLASEVGGLALALCSAKAWARKDEDHGKAKERRHLPMEQKESIRWLEGYEEACKLRESGALLAAVALYLVVAWRILYLRDLARACAAAPGSWFFTEGEWRAALLIFKLPQGNAPPTLGELTTLVAKMGGYLARKSDPPPGAECLWRGLEKLRCYVEMGERLGAF